MIMYTITSIYEELESLQSKVIYFPMREHEV